MTEKNPIHLLLDILPADGSDMLITKAFTNKVGDLLKGGGVEDVGPKVIDDFLWYLHQNEIIALSYQDFGADRINFIKRKV
jgi:hypothetical protein